MSQVFTLSNLKKLVALFTILVFTVNYIHLNKNVTKIFDLVSEKFLLILF